MCNALDDECEGFFDEPLCGDATVNGLGRQSAHTGFGACAGTRCNIARCVDGRGDCNGQQSDGCEASLRDDANHCRACRVQCPFGASCVQGLCARQSFTAVRKGAAFSCLLHSDGRVFCRGSNESRQLGKGTTTQSATPVTALGVRNAVELARA